MRVLHVIPSVSPAQGGPSTVIFPMAAALRARGLDVEIATTDDGVDGFASPCPAPVPGPGEMPLHVFPRRLTRCSPLQRYGFSPAFTRWLTGNVRGYDILHVHALFSHVSTIAMRIARHAEVPYLSRPLGQLGRWPLRQGALRKKLYLHFVERANLAGAEALHLTSTQELSEAGDLGLSTPKAVIPHGIELPELLEHPRENLRARLGVLPEERIVLFLGRLHRKKGIDRLMEVLSLMPEPRPLLLIAGEGPQESDLRELATRLRLEGGVRWLGPVAGSEKQLLLQGADLLALPSHHENFGVSVLEALAAGTPVMVSDQVALAPEITGGNLGIVVPLNPVAIRAGLQRLLATVSDYPRDRLRSAVGSRWSWAANAAALEKLYRATLQNHTRPS